MADKTALPKASVCAAPLSPSLPPELDALKSRAEVNLVEAVALLSQERLTAALVQKVTARTVRAATAMRQLSAALNVKREVQA